MKKKPYIFKKYVIENKEIVSILLLFIFSIIGITTSFQEKPKNITLVKIERSLLPLEQSKDILFDDLLTTNKKIK